MTAIVRLVCSAVGGAVQTVSLCPVEWVEVNNSQTTTLPNGSNRGALIHRGLDRAWMRHRSQAALRRRSSYRSYKGWFGTGSIKANTLTQEDVLNLLIS